MKKKRISAAIAALGLAALSLAYVPMSASAEPEETVTSQSTFTFEKYLVMENDANVPNVSFTFTVAPAAASDISEEEAGKVVPGIAGISFKDTDDVTVASDTTTATVSFETSDGDAAVSQANAIAGKSISFATDDTSDEKFVTKGMALDLSQIPFTEPGIYRYIITETASENVAGVSPDTDNKRILDIYVTNNPNSGATPTLIVQGFVFSYLTGVKSTGFTNQYGTNNLVVAKNVTGNQGSKNKHFKITIQLTNPDGLQISDNDEFTVVGTLEAAPEENSVTSYSATEMAANAVDSLTYGALKDGYSFYLCSGHTVEIKGIPSGLGYTITELPEGYTPSVEYSSTSDSMTGDKTDEGTAISGVGVTESGSETISEYSVSDTYLKSDTTITFKNDRAGTIPTGVIAAVGGALGILAVGAAGVGVGTYCLKKKRSEE